MRTLTDTKVRSLKPSADGKPYDVKDSEAPGLHVRVLGGGQRTFVLLTRFPGSSNPTRRALGTYGELTLEQAREKARTWRNLIRRGVDPGVQEDRERQAAMRQQRTTFAAVAEDFIRDKLPSERKGKEVERDIRREFMPRWAKLPITEITAQDVRDIVKAVKDRGAPYAAHNLLVTIRRPFSWAIDQHVYGLQTSPCDRLKPKAIIGKKVYRTRTLSDDELRAFWRATARLGFPFGVVFKLLLLTGARKSEVAEARWSEIDLTRKLWIVPAERMKGGSAHAVPLTDDVIAILESLPRFTKGDHLFSTTFGEKPVNGFSKAKARLDRLMSQELGELPPFVIHDIRRTVRTQLSAIPNISDLVRELVIGHTKPGLHRVYDQHSYLDEKRRALQAWSERLRSIVEPPPANVVPMREGSSQSSRHLRNQLALSSRRRSRARRKRERR